MLTRERRTERLTSEIEGNFVSKNGKIWTTVPDPKQIRDGEPGHLYQDADGNVFWVTRINGDLVYSSQGDPTSSPVRLHNPVAAAPALDTAVVGGDYSGDAKGEYALDIQTKRVVATQVASGNYSTAIGSHNTASGAYSSAIGYYNTVSGDYTSAFGWKNTGSGTYSVVAGYFNTVSGNYGTVIGYYNTGGTQHDTVAIGYINTASGYRGLAIGSLNTASDSHSVAVGNINTASGARSSAFGYYNTASGNYSSAVGYYNTSSGDNSSAVGHYNTAGGDRSSAVGSFNVVDGDRSVGIGFFNVASGYRSVAAGWYSKATGNRSIAFGLSEHVRGNTASGYKSTALGYEAQARVDYTTNICGPQIIRRDEDENANIAFWAFCGVEVIFLSKEVNLKTVANQTITLQSNCKFWLDELGLIATNIDTLTVQPTIQFGITGNANKHYGAAITTNITTAGKREIETPLVPEDGETSLVAGVTVAATATTALGRFYWKGMLIEDE